MSEFDLIEYLKNRNPVQRTDVVRGIGDDCAILRAPPDCDVAVTTDTLIKGVHFPLDTSPEAIGYKSLAVNLSDLAAAGAEPAWVMLALSLPDADFAWLERFAIGFFHLAQQHQVQLVGGDTTQGPLSITLQAQGFVPRQQALTRSGAQVGDTICVTGALGGAGLELYEKIRNKSEPVSGTHPSLDYPQPRVATGVGLRGIATAAIDISDGLIADLGHILKASQAGADIFLDKIPLSKKSQEYADPAKALELALTGGDDYELCFTVPPHRVEQLQALQEQTEVAITPIGTIHREEGLRIHRADGAPIEISRRGYRHFSGKHYHG